MPSNETPRLIDHWQKVVGLLIFMALWLGISILIFGGHRIYGDFFPLDQAGVGSNVLASFVWLPMAFLGGWIVSEVRNARNLEKHRVMLQEHHTKMADLLGIASPDVTDALNSTPGDRQLDDV